MSDEVQGQLARFLVVRSAGHLEFTLHECIAGYVEEKSIPAIGSFVRSGLPRGANPHPDTLAKQLRRLDPSWGDDLDRFMDEEDGLRRRTLAAMVEQRNKIAHGQNEGVGVRKAKEYAETSVDLGDWLCLRLNPFADGE